MRTGRLGTFGGVFTPSILTILGLILFLRLGYVVGAVGLGEALLIILLASTISVLTSISMAAIATNLEVRSGGVYYIISRTLGLPFGGAIGLVLYVAQAISVGFYCVGFAEGIASLAGLEGGYFQQLIAATAVFVMLAIAWFGAEWATRVQYVVMSLLAAALISFGIGALNHWNPATLYENMGPVRDWGDLWIAFAIFFPAVTGFTQGVNMSGDLADPARSIPRGTAMAVGLSIVVYLSVAILLAATLRRSDLVADYGAMKRVAAFAPLIDAGIVAATLSSALASLLGAPRILQSLAKDRVFSWLLPFAEAGPDNNPRRGLILTAGTALAIVALGNLNLIAAVVSMFFVVTYGLLNYATYFEARGKSPSFRPSLRLYRPWISLLGGLFSLGVMLAIDFTSGLVALAVVFAIYQYLRRGAVAARWSDGRRSYNLQLVREHLHEASSRAEHPRDWRPQILAFSDDGVRRGRLLTFASWIEGHCGLSTVIRIIEGKGRYARRARDQAELDLARDLAAMKLTAFPLVVMGPNIDTVVPIAIQSAGVGPTRINTVLVNWPRQQVTDTSAPEYQRFFRNLTVASSLDCNLLIFDSDEAVWQALENTPPAARLIDIWWSDNRTARLMLVLAYLLTRNDPWRHAKIRLIVAAREGEEEALQARAEAVLRHVRIAAEVLVISPSDSQAEAIVQRSTEASIVFLPLGFRRQQFVDWFGNDIARILPRLPTCIMTMAGEEVDLSADPDQGEDSSRAAALDALDDAVRAYAAAERALRKAQDSFEQKAARPKDDETEGEEAGEDTGPSEAVQELDVLRAALINAEGALDEARLNAVELGILLPAEEPEQGPP
ncbi:amino acid permease [Radicibacter daui]|uniref:amino acid permease n=1 Tax=Radicibacter daui TaxID=3064829 RepID=UPI004046B4F2